MTWSLRYHDGSANAYRFESDGDGARFEYVPVTPEQSSTGVYSGGPPRRGRLDRAKTETLWSLVRGFEANPAVHSKERAKGTGAFHVTDDRGERSFIIARGADLLAFDAFVASL